MKAGREAEETYRRMKETHGLPNRSAKQRNGQRSIGLSLRTLGSGIERDRPSLHLLRSLTSHFWSTLRPDRSAYSIFPPFSVVTSPSRFFYVMHFWCLPLFPFYSLVYWIWSYYGHYLLLGYVVTYSYICSAGLLFSLYAFVLSGLRRWYSLALCLVLKLLLGLVSSESRRQAQLIRAELSSKSSSELQFGVAFQAGLSSNPSLSCQPPMGTFATCGSTTAKGLYANFFFVLTHYAFGGVSAQCVLLALSTPLRLRGRTGVFRRREGPASLPFSRGSPSPCSSSLSSVRGFFSSRGWPPADPVGIRPPFVIKYVFIVEFSYTREERRPGRPDVFPGRDSSTSSPRSLLSSPESSLRGCSSALLPVLGRSDVFPDRD